MPTLSTQLLARLRREAEKLMKDTCKIEQESVGVGSFGQPKPVWLLVVNDLKCRVIMSRQGTRPTADQVGSQEQLVDEYRLIAPYGTAFNVNQRVTVNGDDGATYQVVGLIDRRTDATDSQAVMIRARGQV